MRHLKAGRKLGRNASHRLALYRNLTMALIRHERIITTLEKAKAVRPFVEKLVTLAKKAAGAGQIPDLSDEEKTARALHARRLALARLGPSAKAEVKPEGDDADHRTVLEKLFADIGPRYADRAGGYTRIIKRHQRRLGDAGRTAYLELLKEGEKKVKAKAPAPAPRVEDEEETQEQETQEQETQEPEGQEQTQESPPESEKPGETSKEKK